MWPCVVPRARRFLGDGPRAIHRPTDLPVSRRCLCEVHDTIAVSGTWDSHVENGRPTVGGVPPMARMPGTATCSGTRTPLLSWDLRK